MTPSIVDLTSTDPSLTAGLAVLASEVRKQHQPTTPGPARPADGLSTLFEAELRLALNAADTNRAYEAAAALWRRTGSSTTTHAAISRVLHSIGTAWAAGTCTITHEHRTTTTAQHLLSRLHQLIPRPPAQPPVLLAVAPGEQHQLALHSLEQLLQHAGLTTDLVGELPLPELTDAATHACAVVLSTHTRSRTLTGTLTTTLTALRHAAPQALLAVGGPAAPRNLPADLVSSDPADLITALTGSSPLTTREREVLRCIADGLSNHDTAHALDITPATVKSHLDRVFTKTGATGRAAAVAVALRRGWIS